MEKCLNGTHNFFYSRVHIGTFDNLSFFYFRGKKIGHKKISFFFGNHCKVAIYTGCQKKFIVQHPMQFLPFLRALAEKKLMPHSQISFKSWLHSVNPESYLFFKNK